MLNTHTNLSVNGFDLLQGGQHKHSRLAHTRFGLAQDVHAQDSLWDAFMLHCVFKQHNTNINVKCSLIITCKSISLNCYKEHNRSGSPAGSGAFFLDAQSKSSYSKILNVCKQDKVSAVEEHADLQLLTGSTSVVQGYAINKLNCQFPTSPI